MREHKENVTSKGGGGQTDDAGRAEMEESMTEHRKWSGKGRDVTGSLVEEDGPYKKKKESGRQKPESDRHRWQRDDCPNLQQVLV